jgi:hypothetical protein
MSLAVILLAGTMPAAESIELGLPIDCTLGEDCWVQQYFDHDSGTGVRDYACGLATYDGHDGTDFRIRDTASEAAVLASAPGIVRAIRDGMPDRLVRSEQDKAATADRECGNGVVIDHDAGWQTQYCHMRNGSVLVAKGDRVDRGTRLGSVGYSGLAGFPHVHLTVRRGDTELDPFRPAGGESCGAAGTLWAAEALAGLGYTHGAIISSGFAPGRVEMSALEEGRNDFGPPKQDWPAIVYYGWAINLEAGDTLAVKVTGPEGLQAEHAEHLDRQKAQYMLFTGMKRPASGWPQGTYEAEVTVTGNGTVRLRETRQIRFD